MVYRGIAAISSALLLLVACGGGQKESLSGEYVKRANALCGEWTQALKDLGESPPLGDTGRMGPFTKQQLVIDEGFTARFKEIPASDRERRILASIYASFDAINRGEAGVLDSALRGDRAGIQTFHQGVVDETNKMNVKLRALRLHSCSG